MDLKIKNKSTWVTILVVVVTPMVFPLLLYAHNLGQVRLSHLWRSIVVSILFGLLVFLILYLFVRDTAKASLAAVVIVIASLSYGHVYTLLGKTDVFGVLIGRHRFLAPIYLVLCLVLIRLSWFRVKKLENLITITLGIALLLVLVQTLRISYHEISSYMIWKKRTSESTVNRYTEMEKNRDIYLIVLDAYTRSDLLRDQMEFDNSDFLNTLEEMGFYVVPCSRSNYGYTLQSMSSELNMDYLDNLGWELDDKVLSENLKHSEVRSILDDLGYEFVFFETGYSPTEIDDADTFIRAPEPTIFNDFEVLYLRTTVFYSPYRIFHRKCFQSSEVDIENYVNRVKSAFSGLQHPIESDDPLFVYAHIVSPHFPKVFTRNGGINACWESDYGSSVDGTYTFVQNQTIRALREILIHSDEEPIIILQSDHGDTFENGFRNLNLNAYYLPDGGEEKLYPTITPVNTFRLIFNTYYGMDYPLLPDKVYASPEGSRYEFSLVEDPYEDCEILNQ